MAPCCWRPLQAYGIAVGLQGQGGIVTNPGPFFLASTVITLTGGTLFLMWLGEQITSRGIGNGISLIIFAGIVAGLPSGVAALLELGRTGPDERCSSILAILVMAFAVIAFIVFFERAQRRLLIQYPKRQVGMKMTQAEISHMPLKLNTAGVIPPIFASSLLLLPITVANFQRGQGPDWLNSFTAMLGHGQPLFLLLYARLIVFFCFFYTSIQFNPKETAENLKKSGGFILGIRPGDKTAEYIDWILTRITMIGAAYLVVICLVAGIAGRLFRHSVLLWRHVAVDRGVSVTLDTVAQLQGHMLAQQYGKLLQKASLRSGRNEPDPSWSPWCGQRHASKDPGGDSAASSNSRPVTCCAQPLPLEPRWASRPRPSWTAATSCLTM